MKSQKKSASKSVSKSASKSASKQNSASKQVQEKMSVKQSLCKEMLQNNNYCKENRMESEISEIDIKKCIQKRDKTRIGALVSEIKSTEDIKAFIQQINNNQRQTLLSIVAQIVSDDSTILQQLMYYTWIAQLINSVSFQDSELMSKLKEQCQSRHTVKLLQLSGKLEMLIS